VVDEEAQRRNNPDWMVGWEWYDTPLKYRGDPIDGQTGYYVEN
jgi:hypothetical protein